MLAITSVTGQVLSIVYPVIATQLIRKARHAHTTAHTGAVTLIQGFGSALKLNIHFHMLLLDRQDLLEREAENGYLAADAVEDDSLNQLLGSSFTYPIAIGPQAGHKVLTLQTLPACEPEDPLGDRVGQMDGFSLHAGVAIRTDERQRLDACAGTSAARPRWCPSRGSI